MTEFRDYTYLASGVGAEPVPFEEILETAVSPQMFGATGTFDAEKIDNTAFLRAIETGKNVFVPRGSYHLTMGLELPGDDQIAFGPGLLIHTAGIEELGAITMTGLRNEVRGLRFSNPNELQSSTGGRNAAVTCRSNGGSVRGIYSWNFQNGVIVPSDGEFHDIIIDGNHLLDIVGAVDYEGKERTGDAVLVHGAKVKVTNNFARAKAGTDARIAFHGEGLPGFIVDDAPINDAWVTFDNNESVGPFRRGSVLENIHYGTISKSKHKGVLWWAVALILGSHCSASECHVVFDSTPDDMPDGWDSDQGCFLIRQGSKGHVMHDNHGIITGEADFGLKVHAETDSVPEGASFTENHITIASGGACKHGYVAGGGAVSLDTIVEGNTFDGAFDGTLGGGDPATGVMRENTGSGAIFRGNKVNGRGTTAAWLRIGSGSADAFADQNFHKNVGALVDAGTGSTIGTNYTR